MELKEETKTRRYLNVCISVEVTEYDIKLKIGDASWTLQFGGAKPTVLKGGYVVAQQLPNIEEPFNQALSAMYAELEAVLTQVKTIVETEVENYRKRHVPPRG